MLWFGITFKKNIFWENFFIFFVLYSTLLHLPSLRFHLRSWFWFFLRYAVSFKVNSRVAPIPPSPRRSCVPLGVSYLFIMWNSGTRMSRQLYLFTLFGTSRYPVLAYLNQCSRSVWFGSFCASRIRSSLPHPDTDPSNKKQKTFLKTLGFLLFCDFKSKFFVGILKVAEEKSRIRIFNPAIPDPNVASPEHWP